MLDGHVEWLNDSGAMEPLHRLLLHLRAMAPFLLALCSLLGIFVIELNHNIWWQTFLYDPVIEANVKTSYKRTLPAHVKIEQHPWLRQSIGRYELMGFEYRRECDDIDLNVYAEELKERVALGYKKHQDEQRINFVLTSSSHSSVPLQDDYDNFLPHAEELPSLLYRCALEAAAMVNPAHDIVLYARVKDKADFIARESANNPAFQVLTQLPNFHIVPITNDREFLTDFKASTGIPEPLNFLNKRLWHKDPYLSAHLSDLYRLAIMHKEGGIYADLDSISVQDMRRYPSDITWLVSDMNAVPKGPEIAPTPQNSKPNGFLVNGIFGDVKKGVLTKVALALFPRRYVPGAWGFVGPRLLTEAARYVQKQQLGALELMKTWDFLPIHWSNAEDLHAPLKNIAIEQLFAVSHANQLHVFGGSSLFFNDTPNAATSRADVSVLGATMLNRCPLTYCADRRNNGPRPKIDINDLPVT